MPSAFAQTCPDDTTFDNILGLCTASPSPILCPDGFIEQLGACIGDPQFVCDLGFPNFSGECVFNRGIFDPCPAGFEPVGFQCIKPADGVCSTGTLIGEIGFFICIATPLTGHCPDGTSFDESVGFCISIPTGGDCSAGKTFDPEIGLCTSIPEFSCFQGTLTIDNECFTLPTGSIFNIPPNLSCPSLVWELRQVSSLTFGCFIDAHPNCSPGFFIEERSLCAQTPSSPACPAFTSYGEVGFTPNNFACFAQNLPDCPTGTQLDLDPTSQSFQLCTAMSQVEPTCPSDCNEQGICVDDGVGGFMCECFAGFSGDSCSVIQTFDQEVQSIIDDIDQLVNDNVLDVRPANSLKWLLGATLNADTEDDSILKLQSFIARLNLMINRGLIPADIGQPLIDSAQAIIDNHP